MGLFMLSPIFQPSPVGQKHNLPETKQWLHSEMKFKCDSDLVLRIDVSEQEQIK